MSGRVLDATLRIKVEMADLGFPVVDPFGGRVHVCQMVIEYVDDRDGSLIPINVSGKGFAYRKNGFEVSRSPRNVYGFLASIPSEVRAQVDAAVLGLIEKVRDA